MISGVDWGWKLREAVDRLKTRYEHIGRATGAPFLAVVYPVAAEAAVLREWQTLVSTLGDEFEVHSIDVLKVTMDVMEELGCESIVTTIADPMPGSDPEAELGAMWATAVVAGVRHIASKRPDRKVIIVLERLAALYPASTPRAVMQRLWDCEQSCLEGPVVVLIPGTLVEPRVYSFVDRYDELMYRGDVL